MDAYTAINQLHSLSAQFYFTYTPSQQTQGTLVKISPDITSYYLQIFQHISLADKH